MHLKFYKVLVAAAVICIFVFFCNQIRHPKLAKKWIQIKVEQQIL